MHIGLNWSIELSVEGYEAVFEAAGEDKLFPRLRAVAWNADYVDFNLVNCVLSPSLKNLHFATDSLDVADIEILRDVQEACPGIQRLRYGATQDAKAEHEAVKELVKLAFKFPLVAFSAACVEQSDIPFLATQRSLRKLAIDIGVLHKKGAGVPLWELPQQSFSFINELSLQFPLSLTACKHLLRSSSFLELRALALRPHQLTPQRLASFLQTLRKAIVRPDLLERLDIFEGGPSQWDATTAKPLHEQELTPLLDFPSLTHLVLCSSSDVDISEEMLASMATAWPNLQTLFIYSRCSARKAPLLHVRDLHHIVWGCRHLERLAIRVSAEEEPILTDELPEFGFEHPLKELAISSAPIAQADIVATVIGTYFPRLQTLSWSDEGRDSDRWEHLMFDLGEQVQKKSWKEYLNR
ncbi:hypothetical protein BD626DRAFT_478687 [Schizophyllum amplum]|uniref:F-box domain-containing protein n=1 Tax=Schizophyllum amplum TaxID=97359 RepID=A0A550CRH7_9AGAR|nr:hypothetical protein BD626DRAFT_478687 [Auriculariopsis ampla]